MNGLAGSQGKRGCKFSLDGKHDHMVVKGGQPYWAVFCSGCSHYNLTVDPGKTYRLRVINYASLVMLTFAVEGHKMTIIAADGTPTEPLTVDSVDVNSGQRFVQSKLMHKNPDPFAN